MPSTPRSTCSDDSANEFTKLKNERKERRRNRRIARSVSGQISILNGNQSKSPPDSETLLLTELADVSRQNMKIQQQDESD